jgi:hypothetical protein
MKDTLQLEDRFTGPQLYTAGNNCVVVAIETQFLFKSDSGDKLWLCVA